MAQPMISSFSKKLATNIWKNPLKLRRFKNLTGDGLDYRHLFPYNVTNSVVTGLDRAFVQFPNAHEKVDAIFDNFQQLEQGGQTGWMGPREMNREKNFVAIRIKSVIGKIKKAGSVDEAKRIVEAAGEVLDELSVSGRNRSQRLLASTAADYFYQAADQSSTRSILDYVVRALMEAETDP
jgi:hypothetical protein